jgi:hypothetical protein
MIQSAYDMAANAANMSTPASKLGIKLTVPSYDGSTSLSEFERYLSSLLRYFKIYQLLAPEDDPLRINLVGQALTGPALTWFDQTIDTNDIREKDWTFESVMIALKERFVHKASTQDAADKFDALVQGNSTVIEYYNSFRETAQRMVELPSNYDAKRKFMSGLNTALSVKIMEYGITPEISSLEDIVSMARQVEESRQYIARGQKSAATKSAKADTKTTPRPAAATKPIYTVPKPPYRSWTANAKSVQYVKPNVAGNTGSNRTTTAKPPMNAHASKTTLSSNKPLDRTAIQCYRCKNYGHIATSCPYKTEQLPHTAAAITIAEQTGESPEGDQYDPELYSEEDIDPEIDETYETGHPPQTDNDQEDPDPVINPAQYREEGELEREKLQTYAGTVVPIEEDINESFDVYAGTIVPLEESENEAKEMAATATAQPEPLPTLYRHRACRKAMPGEQPERDFRKRVTLNGYIKIKRHRVHVLIDTGCTTDIVSPDVLAVMGEIPFELDHPVGLQMATKGSRTRINYGYRADLIMGPLTMNHYLDVANVDQYDLILGAGFLRKHKALLDFSADGRATLVIKGHKFTEGIGDFGSPLDMPETRDRLATQPIKNSGRVTNARASSSKLGSNKKKAGVAASRTAINK